MTAQEIKKIKINSSGEGTLIVIELSPRVWWGNKSYLKKIKTHTQKQKKNTSKAKQQFEEDENIKHEVNRGAAVKHNSDAAEILQVQPRPCASTSYNRKCTFTERSRQSRT